MTKLVSERKILSLSFKLMFYVFFYYCGIRLSSIGLVILLPVSCVLSTFVISELFELFLFRMRRRARDAPAAEVADDAE